MSAARKLGGRAVVLGIVALVIWLIMQLGIGGGWGLFPEGGGGSGEGEGSGETVGTGQEASPSDTPTPEPGTGTGTSGGQEAPPQVVLVFKGDKLILEGDELASLDAFRQAVVLIKRRRPDTVFVVEPEPDTVMGAIEDVTEILSRHQLRYTVGTGGDDG